MVPVFADVDTGVDDALGLIFLLASEDVEIVGIASTAGNVSVDHVCANNLGLLELCKAPQIPVSKGVAEPLSAALRTAEDTHGPTGLGYAALPDSIRTLTDYDAAEAWVRAARAHPGELVGLATGPLTNLALALRTEPELPKLLKRLVIMGGSFDYPGNTTPVAEWNVVVDPGATAEVYAAWGAAGVQELPIVCGLNLTETIAMTPEHLIRLAEAAGATTTPPVGARSSIQPFVGEQLAAAVHRRCRAFLFRVPHEARRRLLGAHARSVRRRSRAGAITGPNPLRYCRCRADR